MTRSLRVVLLRAGDCRPSTLMPSARPGWTTVQVSGVTNNGTEPVVRPDLH